MVSLTGLLAVRVQAVLTATSTVTATPIPVAPVKAVKAVEARARRLFHAAGAQEWGGARRCSKDCMHVSQNGL